MKETTRRNVLKTTGAALAAGLAGCSGNSGSSSNPQNAQGDSDLFDLIVDPYNQIESGATDQSVLNEPFVVSRPEDFYESASERGKEILEDNRLKIHGWPFLPDVDPQDKEFEITNHRLTGTSNYNLGNEEISSKLQDSNFSPYEGNIDPKGWDIHRYTRGNPEEPSGREFLAALKDNTAVFAADQRYAEVLDIDEAIQTTIDTYEGDLENFMDGGNTGAEALERVSNLAEEGAFELVEDPQVYMNWNNDDGSISVTALEAYGDEVLLEEALVPQSEDRDIRTRSSRVGYQDL